MSEDHNSEHEELSEATEALLRCPICQGRRRTTVVLSSCSHSFCEACINEAIEEGVPKRRPAKGGGTPLVPSSATGAHCGDAASAAAGAAATVLFPCRLAGGSAAAAAGDEPSASARVTRQKFTCPVCYMPAFKWMLQRVPILDAFTAAYDAAVQRLAGCCIEPPAAPAAAALASTTVTNSVTPRTAVAADSAGDAVNSTSPRRPCVTVLCDDMLTATQRADLADAVATLGGLLAPMEEGSPAPALSSCGEARRTREAHTGGDEDCRPGSGSPVAASSASVAPPLSREEPEAKRRRGELRATSPSSRQGEATTYTARKPNQPTDPPNRRERQIPTHIVCDLSSGLPDSCISVAHPSVAATVRQGLDSKTIAIPTPAVCEALVLGGVWVVDVAWVRTSLIAGYWVSEAPFECPGTVFYRGTGENVFCAARLGGSSGQHTTASGDSAAPPPPRRQLSGEWIRSAFFLCTRDCFLQTPGIARLLWAAGALWLHGGPGAPRERGAVAAKAPHATAVNPCGTTFVATTTTVVLLDSESRTGSRSRRRTRAGPLAAARLEAVFGMTVQPEQIVIVEHDARWLMLNILSLRTGPAE